MGATVTHFPSLVMYFQVSVVDQVLVFAPREPPVRQPGALSQKSDHYFNFLQEKLNGKMCSLHYFPGKKWFEHFKVNFCVKVLNNIFLNIMQIAQFGEIVLFA